MNRKKRAGQTEGSNGFSLIELLITLSIAAILIGFAAPKISVLFPDAKEKTIERFRHALMRARWIAARDEIPVRLTFDFKSQRLVLSEKIKGKEKGLSVFRLPSDVRMVGPWNPSSGQKAMLSIWFYPDGRGGGFGIFLEEGLSRFTAIGYPYRSGVELLNGWQKGFRNG